MLQLFLDTVICVSHKVGVALEQNKVQLKTISVDLTLPSFVKIHWVASFLFSCNATQARNSTVFKWININKTSNLEYYLSRNFEMYACQLLFFGTGKSADRIEASWCSEFSLSWSVIHLQNWLLWRRPPLAAWPEFWPQTFPSTLLWCLASVRRCMP